MTLKEFGLREGNHFIAMEYYRLFLNRTFLVLITEKHLIGLKVNGMVSVEVYGDDLFSDAIRRMAITDDLENPYYYMKIEYLKKMKTLNILGEDILNTNKANFKIALSDIKSVTYDKRKKWGMGYYPHDGKIYVRTIDNKKREFIILGIQSGDTIKSWIEKKRTTNLLGGGLQLKQ